MWMTIWEVTYQSLGLVQNNSSSGVWLMSCRWRIVVPSSFNIPASRLFNCVYWVVCLGFKAFGYSKGWLVWDGIVTFLLLTLKLENGGRTCTWLQLLWQLQEASEKMGVQASAFLALSFPFAWNFSKREKESACLVCQKGRAYLCVCCFGVMQSNSLILEKHCQGIVTFLN